MAQIAVGLQCPDSSPSRVGLLLSDQVDELVERGVVREHPAEERVKPPEVGAVRGRHSKRMDRNTAKAVQDTESKTEHFGNADYGKHPYACSLALKKKKLRTRTR